MTKKIFLSFGDSRLVKSATRIRKEASDMNYNTIIICNEHHLDKNFKEKFFEKLILGSRGYGYWSWKPQIIYQTLLSAEWGDLVQYSDIGCFINSAGQKKLDKYFEILNDLSSGVLAFQYKNYDFPDFYDGRQLPFWPESMWSKGDLFDYFGVRNNNNISNTPQISGGVSFWKKNKESLSFLESWIDVFYNNFSLIDDTPSISDNFLDFVEHRHDQSIFSILCKLNNIKTLSAFEYSYPKISNKNITTSFKNDWDQLTHMPIQARGWKK